MQDITNSIKVLVRQHKQEQSERLGSGALNRLKSASSRVIENNRFSQFVPMGLGGHKLAGRLGEVGGMSLASGGARARALDAAGHKAANGAPAELQLFKDLGDPHAAAKAATAAAQGVLGAEAMGRAAMADGATPSRGLATPLAGGTPSWTRSRHAMLRVVICLKSSMLR